MNKMEKALSELGQMDELAVQDSPVHNLNAGAKLLSTVVYIAGYRCVPVSTNCASSCLL